MQTNASEAEWNTKAVVQLFHKNKEPLEKLPNHKPREKNSGIENNYNMDK